MISKLLALLALSQAPNPIDRIERNGGWQQLLNIRELYTGMYSRWRPADAKRRDQWTESLRRKGITIHVGNFLSKPGRGVITIMASDIGGSPYHALLGVKPQILDNYVWRREIYASSRASMERFQLECTSEFVSDWKRSHPQRN